jgi:putative tricarboxylic transport membrane protein
MMMAVMAGVVLALTVSPAAAWSPTGSVECIAPANPGGGWDTICRTSIRVMEKTGLMTQPAFVTNMPGGSGSVAIANVVEQRKGDPNLIVAASNALTFSMAIQRTPYSYKDVTPLAQVASEYGGYVVAADSKLKTLADLVNALKADPKSVTFAGGSAPGSLDHIKIALLGKAIGVVPTEMVYVPFQGGGEAITALLGGHVDSAALDISEISGQLEAGKVRMLGVMSEERLKGFPELPTLVEQGVDLVFPVWRGVYMAPEVPAEAVAYWVDIYKKMLVTEEWAAEARKLGWEPVTRFGDEFARYAIEEEERYESLLQELGFTQ